jgi:hypothetical protein
VRRDQVQLVGEAEEARLLAALHGAKNAQPKLTRNTRDSHGRLKEQKHYVALKNRVDVLVPRANAPCC